MAQRLWLLVEWTDEAYGMFKSYDVVNTKSLMEYVPHLEEGTIVFIRDKHTKGAREAVILGVSVDKSNLKEQQLVLEMKEKVQKMQNAVARSMHTIKEMQNGSMMNSLLHLTKAIQPLRSETVTSGQYSALLNDNTSNNRSITLPEMEQGTTIDPTGYTRVPTHKFKQLETDVRHIYGDYKDLLSNLNINKEELIDSTLAATSNPQTNAVREESATNAERPQVTSALAQTTATGIPVVEHNNDMYFSPNQTQPLPGPSGLNVLHNHVPEASSSTSDVDVQINSGYNTTNFQHRRSDTATSGQPRSLLRDRLTGPVKRNTNEQADPISETMHNEIANQLQATTIHLDEQFKILLSAFSTVKNYNKKFVKEESATQRKRNADGLPVRRAPAQSTTSNVGVSDDENEDDI